MSAILEIRDDVAVGPIHMPAETRYLGNGNVVAEFDLSTSPLEWPTLCGTEGYVYDRDGLLALHDDLKDCFECRVRMLAPKKQREPARLRPSASRVCAGCGGSTSHPSHRMCRACYLDQPGPACGTRSRYVLGCRCAECRASEAAYSREYKLRRKAA